MNKTKHTCYRFTIMAVMFSPLLSLNSHAHEYTNLNEIMIDRTNDSIAANIVQVQTFLSDIFRQRYKAETWPDIKITVLRNDLMHQKEEANMSLDYFVANGVNIQSMESLFNNPLAGRALAANQGIETTYALLKHVNDLESQEEFIKEIYSAGMSAYMYNLITAYREKMDLYKSIFITVPGPGQVTPGPVTGTVAEVKTPILPYAIALTVFCMVVIGMLIRKKIVDRKFSQP
jgi:hypothetical protein